MMNPVTPQQSDPIIGQMVGTYRVEAEIGRGGMGVVYLAKEITLGVSAALKVLSPRWAADPKRCDEFLEEAKTLARVRPNDFVKVRSFETLRDGSPAFLMEFIDGRSLASMLADSPGTPLSVSQALGIARRVASAMAAAHAAGIIHRESTPPSIPSRKRSGTGLGKRRENRSYIHLLGNGCPGFLLGMTAPVVDVESRLRGLATERVCSFVVSAWDR